MPAAASSFVTRSGSSRLSSAQLHRRSVRQHFGDTLCELRRVVAHGDDAVRALLLSVLHHSLVSLFAGSFADLGVRLDVAADHLFQAAKKPLSDARRADDDAAHDTDVLCNRMARD